MSSITTPSTPNAGGGASCTTCWREAWIGAFTPSGCSSAGVHGPHDTSTAGVLISPRAVCTARTRPLSTMSRCAAVVSQISAPSRRAAAAKPAAVA